MNTKSLINEAFETFAARFTFFNTDFKDVAKEGFTFGFDTAYKNRVDATSYGVYIQAGAYKYEGVAPEFHRMFLDAAFAGFFFGLGFAAAK